MVFTVVKENYKTIYFKSLRLDCSVFYKSWQHEIKQNHKISEETYILKKLNSKQTINVSKKNYDCFFFFKYLLCFFNSQAYLVKC